MKRAVHIYIYFRNNTDTACRGIRKYNEER